MVRLEVAAFDKSGSEVTLRPPTTREVCWRCSGNGTHASPGVDSNGFEWEHLEELEDYLAGVYDVRCYECHGARVVDEIDWDEWAIQDPDGMALYRSHLEDLYLEQAARAAELRAGC